MRMGQQFIAPNDGLGRGSHCREIRIGDVYPTTHIFGRNELLPLPTVPSSLVKVYWRPMHRLERNTLHMRKHYNKLVRDHIPEIIRQHGEICQTKIMTESEFQQALRQKVVEEAQEVMQATTQSELIQELTDLYEVVEAILHTNNITLDALRTEQEQRRTTRGGFTQRIKLLWTE